MTRMRDLACSARAISTSCCSAIDRSPTSGRGPKGAPSRSSIGPQPSRMARAVDQPARPLQLAAEVDVLGNRQVRREASSW